MDPHIFATRRRAGGTAGIAAVTMVAIACLISALPYVGSEGERYSPLSHWISELGEFGVSTLAIVFSAALVLASGGFALLHVRLFETTTGRLRYTIAAAGLVAAVLGGLVGVFPMNIPELHRPVALWFFLTGWVAPALLAARLLAGPRDGLPRWLVVPGVAAAAAFLSFVAVLFTMDAASLELARPEDRPAVWLAPTLEWATLVTILAWTACVGFVLRRVSGASDG